MSVAALIASLQFRLEWLVPLLCVGFLFGEFLARYSGLNRAIEYGHHRIARLEHKLDKRTIATRIYRGIIALILVTAPMVVLGLALHRPHVVTLYLSPLLLLALFGRAVALPSLFILWRQARLGKLSLELPRSDFLFPDTHGVLRYAIMRSSERFAVGLVGSTFWFLLGGMPAMLGYLAIATCAHQFREMPFGWAARNLFRLLDALPRALTALLLLLAALFIPHAHPFATRRARNWHGFTAELLGASLGGPMPEGARAWAGSGTPKLEAGHLGRWLLLMLVATILLVWLIATPTIIKVLNHII